jgi:uncharacterized protein (TIGR00369 family)
MMGAAQFEARDPQFEARVRASFARQGAMALLGAHLVGVAPGAVAIALPFRGDLTQQHGYLHAAVVTAILDSACGYAALSLLPAGIEVLTIEYKVNFVAPARGRRVIARAGEEAGADDYRVRRRCRRGAGAGRSGAAGRDDAGDHDHRATSDGWGGVAVDDRRPVARSRAAGCQGGAPTVVPRGHPHSRPDVPGRGWGATRCGRRKGCDGHVALKRAGHATGAWEGRLYPPKVLSPSAILCLQRATGLATPGGPETPQNSLGTRKRNSSNWRGGCARQPSSDIEAHEFLRIRGSSAPRLSALCSSPLPWHPKTAPRWRLSRSGSVNALYVGTPLRASCAAWCAPTWVRWVPRWPEPPSSGEVRGRGGLDRARVCARRFSAAGRQELAWPYAPHQGTSSPSSAGA